jgi:hypothetical protein
MRTFHRKLAIAAAVATTVAAAFPLFAAAAPATPREPAH